MLVCLLTISHTRAIFRYAISPFLFYQPSAKIVGLIFSYMCSEKVTGFQLLFSHKQLWNVYLRSNL